MDEVFRKEIELIHKWRKLGFGSHRPKSFEDEVWSTCAGELAKLIHDAIVVPDEDLHVNTLISVSSRIVFDGTTGEYRQDRALEETREAVRSILRGLYWQWLKGEYLDRRNGSK